MGRKRQDIINDFLSNPQKLLLKKPFTRGTGSAGIKDKNDGKEIVASCKSEAILPRFKRVVVSQERFAKELDPQSHDVIFDNNLPSICVKLDGGGFQEINFKKFGLPMQIRIKEKKVLALCGNKRIFTLHDSNPSETQKKNYADFKWHWEHSKQDSIETRAVDIQQSDGDVGLRIYMNEDNEVKARLFSYEYGYQIITHKDDNGEPLLDCVYYQTEDGVRHIDAYDRTYHYHFVDSAVVDVNTNDIKDGWAMLYSERHGFTESPLVTKRGAVAWDKGQGLIELFEIIFNLFAVIQKRHGWGILYIKGKINEKLQKLAGSIILQDTTIDGKGNVEFKAPPSPQNMIEFMQTILDQLEIATGCTFILPKDVKSSGDISGLAIQMTRSLDIESAANSVIEWQNFVSKHARLFKEGLAKQFVANGENKNAITEFEQMKISASFKPWQPFDENSYNQMLCTLKGSGLISTKTGIEKNTISTPDEEVRLQRESNTTPVEPAE